MLESVQSMPVIGSILGLLLVLFGVVGFVVVAMIAIAAYLKLKANVDVTDGIDTEEWDRIRNIYKARAELEKTVAAKERMILAASDDDVAVKKK
jgi:hypothetical protein